MIKLRSLVLFALASAPAQAQAFVQTRTSSQMPMRWSSPCVPVVVYAAEPPAALTSTVLTQAVKGATYAWSRTSVTCTGVQIVPEFVNEASGPATRDKVNRITFRRTKWCREPATTAPCYDPSTLAVTAVTAQKEDGYIVDADIEVNAVNHVWADKTATSSPKDAQDLRAVLTHELGHLLGFDHNCQTGTTTMLDHAGKPVPECGAVTQPARQAVMYPSASMGSTAARTLSADDRKAVCDTYPLATMVRGCGVTASTDAGRPAGDGGGDAEAPAEGCAIGGRHGGGAGPGALFGALLLLAHRWPRRGRG